MRQRLVDWARPLTPRTLALIAVVTFVGTLLGMTTVFGWAPPLWVRVSLNLREGSFVPGLVTAVVAAGCSSMISGRASLLGGPDRARAGWPTAVRHLTRLVASAWLGVTLALAVTLPVVAVRASAGHLGILAMTEGYLVTACWILLGYAIGAVLPPGWAQCTALVAVVTTWALPSLERTVPLFAVFPIWSLDWPYLGDSLVVLTSVFRIVFFAGLGLTLLVFAARSAERHRLSVRRRAVFIAWPLLPIMAVAGVALWQRPPLVEVEPSAPIDCASTDVASVCLHAGLAPLLKDAVEATSAVAQLGASARTVKVVENSASTEQPDADLVIRADLTSRTSFQDQWASQTALMLAGASACDDVNQSGDESLERLIATEAVANELTVRAGYRFIPSTATSNGHMLSSGSPIAKHLTTLTSSDLKAWMLRHRDELAACTKISMP